MKQFLLVVSVFILIACSSKLDERKIQKQKLSEIKEAEVIQLPLDDFASNPKMEFSGLTWYKDNLILLPQYPSKVKDGNFLYLKKSDILNSIENMSELNPRLLKVDLSGLEDYENIGSGYEAIAFKGDSVFVSIEAMNLDETIGIIVSGKIDSTNMQIDFDESNLVKLPSISGIDNYSEEAIVLTDSTLIAIHEFNEAERRAAFEIPFDLKSYRKIEIPQINYRITDATTMDDSSEFYAINYFWHGDDSTFPIDDHLFAKWGMGETNKKSYNIERIIKLKIEHDEIKLVNNSPIYLKLEKDGRNWEGIVKLGKMGFLMITDKFPGSILGFVPLN